MGFFQAWLYPPNLLSSSLRTETKERPFHPPRQGQTPEFTKRFIVEQGSPPTVWELGVIRVLLAQRVRLPEGAEGTTNTPRGNS